MLEISYAYHIKVNGQVVFLGSELEVTYEGFSKPRAGTLTQIGPSGIYLELAGVKNNLFVNFKKIRDFKVLKEAKA